MLNTKIDLTFRFAAMLLVVIASGNLLAIAIHVLTWWLRRHRLLKYIMAVTGVLSLVLLFSGLCILYSIDVDGGFNYAEDAPPLPQDWQFRMLVRYLATAFTLCAVLSAIGWIQKKHVAVKWGMSTLYCAAEFAVSLVVWLTSTNFFLSRASEWAILGYHHSQPRMFQHAFGLAFGISLFVLACLRPSFLIVLKSIESHLMQKNRI